MAAAAFIQGANGNKCNKLKDDLENSFIQNDDRHPKDLLAAHNLLTNWKQTTQQGAQNRRNNGSVGETAFATVMEETDSDSSDDERDTALTNVDTSRQCPHI